MRTFVAIELPEHIREAVGRLSARLRRSGARVSWVRPDRMHLTLRFLGDVTEEQSDSVGEHLAGACQGSEPFVLSVSGAGAFPNVRKPNVVWAGVRPLEGALARLQAAAEEAARQAGLAPEAKPFHPHLTLARIRDRRDLGDLVERLGTERAFEAGDFTVSGVALFSSQLTPKGPVYQRLRTIAL